MVSALLSVMVVVGRRPPTYGSFVVGWQTVTVSLLAEYCCYCCLWWVASFVATLEFACSLCVFRTIFARVVLANSSRFQTVKRNHFVRLVLIITVNVCMCLSKNSFQVLKRRRGRKEDTIEIQPFSRSSFALIVCVCKFLLIARFAIVRCVYGWEVLIENRSHSSSTITHKCKFSILFVYEKLSVLSFGRSLVSMYYNIWVCSFS